MKGDGELKKMELCPIEVEVKIPVTQWEKLCRRLEECGFVSVGVRRETDIYYNSVNYDLRAHDKALRIRRITDLETGESWAEFNCKGPKLDHVSVSRKEIEIKLERPEEMEGILEELSFYPVEVSVTKTRYQYRKGRITAAADRVEGLGDFLELEILAQGEENREPCLKEIETVMVGLGYKREDTVRDSYLSLLQFKRTCVREE